MTDAEGNKGIFDRLFGRWKAGGPAALTIAIPTRTYSLGAKGGFSLPAPVDGVQTLKGNLFIAADQRLVINNDVEVTGDVHLGKGASLVVAGRLDVGESLFVGPSQDPTDSRDPDDGATVTVGKCVFAGRQIRLDNGSLVASKAITAKRAGMILHNRSLLTSEESNIDTTALIFTSDSHVRAGGDINLSGKLVRGHDCTMFAKGAISRSTPQTAGNFHGVGDRGSVPGNEPFTTATRPGSSNNQLG